MKLHSLSIAAAVAAVLTCGCGGQENRAVEDLRKQAGPNYQMQMVDEDDPAAQEPAPAEKQAP